MGSQHFYRRKRRFFLWRRLSERGWSRHETGFDSFRRDSGLGVTAPKCLILKADGEPELGYDEAMFVFREDDASGPWVISQNSHAWMAWQIARHWGNRSFSRPSQRAETEAAVLLHDCGWSEYDRGPELDEEGRIRTFDRMLPRTHLRLWRASVSGCEDRSRYAAGLVAHHFSRLSGRKLRDLMAAGDLAEAGKVQAFEAEMQGLRAGWREKLGVDPRYADALDGWAFQCNSLILGACDRLSVFLCASMSGNFELRGATKKREIVPIRVEDCGDRRFSLSPWPLEGKKLKLHCEARHLRRKTFHSREACRKALEAAPVHRLDFELLSPSEVGK